jgi:2-polyprenyl-6-methoxyphenol hydroxylase-like FAD-dependent oxidoreductase
MVGKAAIIGGSMSGLFAALILKRRGWSVDIYESSPKPLAGRGAGIITHAGLGTSLAAAGLVAADDLGVPVRGRRVYNLDGTVHGSIDFPQTNTSWDRLFDLLKSELPPDAYHPGKRLASIRTDAEGAKLTFEDGSTARADLVVGADGFRSTVRRSFLPHVNPTYAGYVAWRGLVEEAALSRAAREALFDSFTFCLPPGEQMLGYPVAGRDNDLRPGHRRFNFVWYRPAEAAVLDRMLTEESGKRHDVSIPPPLIASAVIEEMRAGAGRVLAPLFREAVGCTEAPFFQPIYDLAVPCMTAERIALIGDAAFVARPHVGAGVTKAAEDALALGDSLSRHDALGPALAAFESERLPIGHRIVDQARRLGSYMQAQIRTAEEQEAAERHRSPEAVMVETASVAFLERCAAE